jgi:hypothetical protein
MVAKLGAGAAADPAGIPEWEAGNSGKLEIANNQRVPSIRVDTRLAPTGEAIAGAFLKDIMGGGAEPVLIGAPAIDFVGGGWSTESGWNQSTGRRLPRPTAVFVEAGGNPLVFAANSRISDVSWAVEGAVSMPSGTVVLATSTVATGAAAYGGGAAGCTVEVAGIPRDAWNNGARSGRPVLVASGPIEADAANVSLFGKVVSQGRVRVGTPALGACLVGGISVAGDGAQLAGCSAGPCDDVGFCMTDRNALVGSVFTGGGAPRDILVSQGMFAQRGTDDSLVGEIKISQIMASGNVCITGSSRIVGQVVSDAPGGTIRLGPDVLMVQSGEIGFGFATKKTTWSDSSW